MDNASGDGDSSRDGREIEAGDDIVGRFLIKVVLSGLQWKWKASYMLY